MTEQTWAEREERRPGEGEFEYMRRLAFADLRPSDWPPDVRMMSGLGVGLLGVHEKTGELYWDGKPVAIRPPVRLGTFERWAAALATMGTVGTFIVEVGRSAGFWGG